LQQWQHYCTYNAHSGAMESWIVSLKKQDVYFGDIIDREFSFDKMEGIHVEMSYKYSLKQIEQIAEESGFEIVNNYFDENQWFVDSLWKVK